MIFLDRIQSERRRFPHCEATVKKVFAKCDACGAEQWLFYGNVRGKPVTPYFCRHCVQNPFKEPHPCIGCGIIIPWHPKTSRCIECKRQHGRERYADEGKRRRDENRQRAFIEKGGKCANCGYTGPTYHFDFHHEHDKQARLAALWSYTWGRVKTELDKCTMLCALCHRDTHNVPTR